AVPGEEVAFTRDEFTGADLLRLVFFLKRMIGRRIVGEMATQVEGGDTLYFSSIRVDRRGIGWGEHFFPWSDFEGLGLKHNLLVFERVGDPVVTDIGIRDQENLEGLLALVEVLTGKARERGPGQR